MTYCQDSLWGARCGNFLPPPGMSLGSVVATGTSGWIINHLGWEWVFYGGGILSLLWTPLWLALVRNSPKNHPFISSHELSILSYNIHIKPKVSLCSRRLQDFSINCKIIYSSENTCFVHPGQYENHVNWPKINQLLRWYKNLMNLDGEFKIIQMLPTVFSIPAPRTLESHAEMLEVSALYTGRICLFMGVQFDHHRGPHIS